MVSSKLLNIDRSEPALFHHIHHALDQVRELRARVIENQEFRGYSGWARGTGGVLALLLAVVVSLPWYPQTILSHFWAWGILAAVAGLLNYCALGAWYLKQEDRELAMLRPAVDALPPLAAGGVLTALLHYHGAHDLLFVVWMVVFGLVNMSSRRSLPMAIWYLGIYYLSCGALLALTIPEISFTNPWPMAIVFFVGELLGGYFFRHQLQSRTRGEE